MAGKRFKPEEIVAKLRQVEVLQGQGSTVVDAIRPIGVTEVTYYRYRRPSSTFSPDRLGSRSSGRRLKGLARDAAALLTAPGVLR